MAGTGIIVSLLAFALPLFGVNVEEKDVVGFVDNIMKVVGFVLLIWGQVRRKDLTAGLIRK